MPPGVRCMSVPPPIVALAARTRELAALLEQWSNINSGSDHVAGLERMRSVLRVFLTNAFPAAIVDEPLAAAEGITPPGVRALRVRMRPSAPVQVLLSGHYDTVYEAGSAFQTCRWLDESTLNGPGVADMKGGLVTLFAALQAFEQTPFATRLGWEVLLDPDEETGSRGSAPLLAEAARRHDFGLVFEPARANGAIVQSRKGVGDFVATCRGRAAHAGKSPNDGRNAILALAEYALAISRIPVEMAGVLVNVGSFQGGSAATNIVPETAIAGIDIRITKAGDQPRVLERLASLARPINAREGLHLEITGGFNRPPKECMPAEEAAFAQWQLAAADLGLPALTWVHTGGGSDGNLLTAAGLPNLDGLGPVGDHLHSDRECCQVETIPQRAQIAALFLHRLAAQEIKLPKRGPA